MVTGEEEDYRLEEEQVEEDVQEDSFSSVISTLTWLALQRTEDNITVECRCGLPGVFPLSTIDQGPGQRS